MAFNNATKDLLGLFGGRTDSQMVGPQQVEGLAGMFKDNPQAPTPSINPQAPAALGGLSQDAVPSDGDMQFAMNILGQNQGSAPASTPSGGGMFDAYSPQNQTNLQMAMIADMIGNFAGKDVGAVKTMMPLAENARKLRLQQEENAAFNKMVEGMPPDMQAMVRNAPKSLQSTIMQGAIARLNQKPADQWGEPYVGQFGNLLRKNKTTNKVERVSGPQDKGSEVNVNTGPNYLEKMGYEEMSAANLSQSKLAEGAASKLATHGRMLDVLTATKKDEHGNAVTDSYGNPVYVTDVGAMSKATLPFRNLYNSAVEELGGAEGLKKIGLSPATLQFVFESDNKDLALLAAALMKGNLSEKELDFSVDLFAKLGNTREANIILTKVGMMKEQGVIARNKHMNEWELNQAKSGVTSAHTLNLLRKTELESFNRTLRKNNGYRMQAVWYENDKNFTMSEEAIDFMYKEKGGSYAQ